MADFPTLKHTDPIVISTCTPQSLGDAMNSMGFSLSSLSWSTANKAIYIPVSIFATVTIVKMLVINGAAVSGNIDVGIYDRGGVRLASSGSTAQSGTSAIQEFNITDITLNPGLYYFACAMDNTTGTLETFSPSLAISKIMGIAEQTSAFALPSTATFATVSATFRTPFIGATQRTVV